MIQVENLKKIYKIPKKKAGFLGKIKTFVSNEYEIVKALDGITFSVNQGEKVAYIGPNGAGKSTTIKILTGIMTPTSGNCLINGLNPHKNRSENLKNIGVIFGQRTQLWWDLPVKDSFNIIKRIYDIPDLVFKNQYELLVNFLSLSSLLDMPVRTLSLGQRMRIEVAAGFLHRPKTIFLDEPTIGLDQEYKDEIRNLINYLNREEKTTVILTSHDLEDVESICDRIILIDEGLVKFDDSLDSFRNFDNLGKIKIEWEVGIQNTSALEEMLITIFPGLRLIKTSTYATEIIYNKTEHDPKLILSYAINKMPVKDISKGEADLKTILKNRSTLQDFKSK